MIYILILKDFWFLWDISTSFVKLEKHTVRSDTFCFNALCEFFSFLFFIHCSFYCFFFFFWKVFFFIFDPETETYDSMFLDVCSEKRMLFGLASCLSVHNCNFGYTHTIDFVCKMRFVERVVFVQLCIGPIHKGCFHSRIQKVCYALQRCR